MTLAYVFWHWTDTADIADYEKRLAGFHRALVGARQGCPLDTAPR
jgi:hypothetical protein